MTQSDWAASYANSLAVFLNGDAISEPDPRGEKIGDARFLLLFNAHSEPLTFTLPGASFAAGWETVIDTAFGLTGSVHTPKSQIEVCDRTVVVLRSTE
jgi:isoamylase